MTTIQFQAETEGGENHRDALKLHTARLLSDIRACDRIMRLRLQFLFVSCLTGAMLLEEFPHLKAPLVVILL